MGRRGDPGKIQGRSIDLRSSVFRGVGGSMEREREGKVLAKRARCRDLDEGEDWEGAGRGRDKDDRVWRSP